MSALPFDIPKLPDSAATGALSAEDRKKLMMIKMLQGQAPGAMSAGASPFEGLSNVFGNAVSGYKQGQLMQGMTPIGHGGQQIGLSSIF